MRLLLYCAMLVTLFSGSSLTAYTQADEVLPPTTTLMITSKQIGTATTRASPFLP